VRAIAARWAWPAALVACLAAAGFLSVATGLDVNWDLKNYHYYDAYAYLTGRLGWDVAPAQIQTYHNPLLDLGFYALVQEIPSPRVIAFAMAMPAGIAAFFLLRMLVSLFPPAVGARALYIAAAFAIGVTGASGRAMIGSTMDEWQPAMLLIISLSVLVTSIARGAIPSVGAMVLAGVATGFAVGLKLTYGVFAVALVVAIASSGSWRERLSRAAIIGICLLAGFAVTYGFWGATLWKEFGNPFFPYFNNIFQSPWWESTAWFDRNFGPHGALEAIFFPFAFAWNNRLVSETGFCDWRLPAVMAIAMACGLRYAIERLRKSSAPSGLAPRPWIFLAVFMLAAYLVWLPLYAIYRYLVPLEVISGPLIVGGAMWLVRGHFARVLAVVAVAAVIVGTTQPPDFGRLPFRGAYFDIDMPDIAPRALVILGPYDPMSYAIPFVRPDARFVSPSNNLLQVSQENLLARKIAGIIATHEGPLYSLDLHDFDRMGEVLTHFGLARIRESCLKIRSYLDNDNMQVCRLERVKPGP
jgi:hypothetical protein